MATMTAHILAGHGHANDGGIIPHASLALYENSRANWQLTFTNMPAAQRARFGRKRVWVPSCPDRIFEDGLLMLSLFVWQHQEVRTAAGELEGLDLEASWLDLTALEPEHLEVLSDIAKAQPTAGKIVLTVLNDSYLEHQWPQLTNWPLHAEVCTPRWWRTQTQWQDAPSTGGSLAPETGGLF